MMRREEMLKEDGSCREKKCSLFAHLKRSARIMSLFRSGFENFQAEGFPCSGYESRDVREATENGLTLLCRTRDQ